MKAKDISINKASAVLLGIFCTLSAALLAGIYLLTGEKAVLLVVLLYVFLVLVCVSFFLALIRQKLLLFSDTLCQQLDRMAEGETALIESEMEENLFYKINHRLVRLYEIMLKTRESIAKERTMLKELISDISHQVKTPITNLKMVNITMQKEPMSEEKRIRFLLDSETELDKLDFLLQAMIKTSRLETGIISLEKKIQPVYDTLASALGSILFHAEKKQMEVSVDCPADLKAYHDRKWTGEALFNILDNAVKYSPKGGKIDIHVEGQELYLKIDIADTGKGIPENLHGAIFRRFYRENGVHDNSGVGIGLYLAREIITMQGGYIKVASEVGKGSVFSVFLLRERNA